ncbi:MAG: excalibur calcium-binding domain-containing protein [Alphaproteobacteria bacterium]|nr:MAG: excalibur calcium-binding domain-containing protein [Alphaproteobacteria bacterium]
MTGSTCIRWLVLAFFAAPALAFGHSGGLNSDGCHNNRKTGDYHCHRAPAPAAPSAPRQNLAPSSVAPRRQGAFANCAAARAAGAAPVRRGDPGYGSHLDRDNDGVGCE